MSVRAANPIQVCSTSTAFFLSALGFVSPARVCFLLLSSLTLRASSIVPLSFDAWYTDLGRCRVLDKRTIRYRCIRQKDINVP